MFSSPGKALLLGVRYVEKHPQLILTLLLMIIIPVAFFVSGQRFLEVAEENQNSLERGRVGLIQDVFTSLLYSSNYDAELMQSYILDVSRQNPDITKFIVAKETQEGVIPIASLDPSYIGVAEKTPDLYNFSKLQNGESLIFPYKERDIRYWQAFRAIETLDGSTYFLMTELSFENVDGVFKQRAEGAYLWLGALLLVIGYLLYRQLRLIDYGYMYKEAKKAIETKDLFTNMIAHELRAPLTAIRGYASLVQEEKGQSERTRIEAKRIADSAERLILIVNDLLDVARIQSGKLQVEKSEVDVCGVIKAVVEEIESSAVDKNIELVVVNTGTPVLLITDPKRLHQILTNLVSNAIKYTKQGKIEIALEAKHDRAEIRVKDTGSGISAEDQQKLFAPFFRVQSQSVSEITGSGLGMWITKQLTELIGASIAVESIKSVGTHVVVTLPRKVR